MFIAALFIIIKIWKQPKCSTINEKGKDDVLYIYDGILLSHEKRARSCNS